MSSIDNDDSRHFRGILGKKIQGAGSTFKPPALDQFQIAGDTVLYSTQMGAIFEKCLKIYSVEEAEGFARMATRGLPKA
jgi:hypothetical protein